LIAMARTAPDADHRSLGQARLSHPFRKLSHVLRPAKRGQVLEIGKTQSGIHLAQAGHYVLRSLNLSGERVGRGGYAERRGQMRTFLQRLTQRSAASARRQVLPE
jgi:hypothetical protein